MVRHGWELSVRKTDTGYTLDLREDPDAVRARREAREAFRQFVRKARAAGLTPLGLAANLLGVRVSYEEESTKKDA